MPTVPPRNFNMFTLVSSGVIGLDPWLALGFRRMTVLISLGETLRPGNAEYHRHGNPEHASAYGLMQQRRR